MVKGTSAHDSSTDDQSSTFAQMISNESGSAELTDAERAAMEHLSEDVEGKSVMRSTEAPYPTMFVKGIGYGAVAGAAYEATTSGVNAAADAAGDAASDAADAVSDAVLSTPRAETPEGVSASPNASVEDLLEVREEATN